MEPSDIQALFRHEFRDLAERFDYIELSASQVALTTDPRVARGGVYVWWRAGQVVKVGRSMPNTRRRALEHLTDDTGGEMSSLRDDPSARLLLFNVRNPDSIHWAFALEVFFERVLHPEVRSKRTG